MSHSLQDILLGKCMFDRLELVVKGEACQKNTSNIGFHQLLFSEGEHTKRVSFENLLLAINMDDILFSALEVSWPYSQEMAVGNGLYKCVNSSAKDMFRSLIGINFIEHFVYQDIEYCWQFFAQGVLIENN